MPSSCVTSSLPGALPRLSDTLSFGPCPGSMSHWGGLSHWCLRGPEAAPALKCWCGGGQRWYRHCCCCTVWYTSTSKWACMACKLQLMHAGRSAGAVVVAGVPTAQLRCPESFQDPAIKALITAPSTVPSSWRQLSQPLGRPLCKHAGGRHFCRHRAAVATCQF